MDRHIDHHNIRQSMLKNVSETIQKYRNNNTYISDSNVRMFNSLPNKTILKSLNIFILHRLRNKFQQLILISLDSASLELHQYSCRMCGPMKNPKVETILDWSKLKAFADDKINVNEKLNFGLGMEDNIVGKGEIAGHQQFLLFPQCFQKLSVLGSFKLRIMW